MTIDHKFESIPGVGRHAPFGFAHADDGSGDDAAHAVPLPLQRRVEDGAILPARFANSPIVNPVSDIGLVLERNPILIDVDRLDNSPCLSNF